MMQSDVCLSDVRRRLTSVAYIRPAGGMCGRLGWRVLPHRARLGRPGSRLPLRASVAGGGSILWRLPAQLIAITIMYVYTPLKVTLRLNFIDVMWPSELSGLFRGQLRLSLVHHLI